MSNNTPSKQNFSMPAEWHPHSATQLHWPTNRQTWPGKRLERVEKVFLDIIEILHKYEPIHLFVNSGKVKNHALSLLKSRSIDLQLLTFHLQRTNDVWARDCGPIFVCRKQNDNEEFAITDWEYNTWGGKYPPYNADNAISQYVADKYDINRFQADMVLEGGSIDTNGEGVLLTTESVLMNENRNPELSKREIEQRLKNYLGIEKIIWLNKGLVGDDTDGHIDDLARFITPDTILAMICEDTNDVNYDVLCENLNLLQNATDQHGHTFNIETLPLPKTKVEGTTVDGSEHVPASYANFYIANGVVLVPVYNEDNDARALNLFKKYFPNRDVHGIPCVDLVWGQGSIHCITQQWYSPKQVIHLNQ